MPKSLQYSLELYDAIKKFFFNSFFNKYLLKSTFLFFGISFNNFFLIMNIPAIVKLLEIIFFYVVCKKYFLLYYLFQLLTHHYHKYDHLDGKI